MNFDQVINRTASESVKWRHFDADVLPMWVADMDFQAPQPVIDALQARVSEGVFGYPGELDGLKDAILARLEKQYQWKVDAEAIVYLPGVVNGFNLVTQALAQPGSAQLIQTPVYPPFYPSSQLAGLNSVQSELILGAQGRYEVDWEDFERAAGKNISLFLLCNPHNPVGRVYEQDELSHMAEICLRNDIMICADEIHCDLVYSGHHHLPIASLDAEIANRTITLMAPSKTYNIPGLGFSFAIVTNPELRDRLKQGQRGLLSHPNVLGLVAARAAYQSGAEWLAELLLYLEQNRDYLVKYVTQNLPGVRTTTPEGTYLAWLDCRGLDLQEEPYDFFLREARVGLNEGRPFGQSGSGFVRLNFGCPRSVLQEGLQRMETALKRLKG
jgi:cystathionine beta-lyase